MPRTYILTRPGFEIFWEFAVSAADSTVTATFRVGRGRRSVETLSIGAARALWTNLVTHGFRPW